MTNLIVLDKQAVIDAVIKECNSEGAYGYMDAKSIIDLLNRMSEAIIRCKDCKHRERKYPFCSRVTNWVRDDFYCADGERRDDGDE